MENNRGEDQLRQDLASLTAPEDSALVHPADNYSLKVSASFFPLAFFFFFCKPTIDINGALYQCSWGTHCFSLSPGNYNVTVYFPYIHLPKCGLNSVAIELLPGSRKHVTFYMWPWMFARGSMSVYDEINSELPNG